MPAPAATRPLHLSKVWNDGTIIVSLVTKVISSEICPLGYAGQLKGPMNREYCAKFIKRRTKQLQHCSCPPCTHTPYTQFIQYERLRKMWRRTCAACTRLSSNSVSPSIVSIDLTDSLDFISRSLGFDSLDWEYSESPTSSFPVLFCLLLSLSASTETWESWMNTHRPQHSWERCSCWELTNDNVPKPNAKQACCCMIRHARMEGW